MSNVLDFQVNGLNPSTVGGLGTTVKYFQRILGTNGPNSGPNTNISATNASGALFLPAAGVFEGQSFNVIASGDAGSDTGDPSGTVDVELYAVTGTAAAPVYTAIAGTGATAPTYTNAEPWSIQATLVGTTNSGMLTGSQEVVLGGAVVHAAVIVTTPIIGLNFKTGNVALRQGAVLGFVVGVTFGTTNSTNTASLYEFTIES
jgi:hypothetical protein